MKNLKILAFTAISFISFNSSSQTTISDSLIAYYQFSGNTSDSSGNNFHALAMNGPTLTTDRHGNPNSAYEFDGVDDYIDCGNIVDMSTIQGFSISAWFNPYAMTTDNEYGGIIIGTKLDGSVVLRVRESSDKRFQVVMGDANESSNRSKLQDLDYNDNTWYHVVGTYANNTVQLYVDAVAQNTDGANPGSIDLSDVPNSPFMIGRTEVGAGAVKYFKGKMDDIRVYNRVLTANEVSILYNTAVGIEDVAETEKFKLFPNPATESLTIDYSEIESNGLTVKIYSISGSLVYTENLSNQNDQMELDISNLSSGMYSVELISGKGTVVQKLVVQ